MRSADVQVEMFKIRMQGQYGGAGDKKLSGVFKDMWRDYGFRHGIMRGYWVRAVPPQPVCSCATELALISQITVVREVPAYAGFYAGPFSILTLV